MPTLPVLISIPHGGGDIPEEIRQRVAVSDRDRFADGDAFTPQIYDIGPEAAFVLKARVARVFVDLNRAETDLPPANPDGVVKTATCHAVPVYQPGLELDHNLTETLLAHYHRPYHATLQRQMKEHPEIKLGLDCHSMESVAPAIAPDSGKPRPPFCLGNRMGTTCPDEWLHRMAECLEKSFELEPGAVALNDPFAGGYITRTYGNRPTPWMQIEMNRNLYLSDPWFDAGDLTVDPDRLHWLNACFLRALKQFFKP